MKSICGTDLAVNLRPALLAAALLSACDRRQQAHRFSGATMGTRYSIKAIQGSVYFDLSSIEINRSLALLDIGQTDVSVRGYIGYRQHERHPPISPTARLVEIA